MAALKMILCGGGLGNLVQLTAACNALITAADKAETAKARTRSIAGLSSPAALAAAKAAKCSVIVSKTDRLSRDVAFVSGLMPVLSATRESGAQGFGAIASA